MRHHASDHESTEVVRHKVELSDALDAATLAIDEYYNGDRAWAEQWLLKALEANREPQVIARVRGNCGKLHRSIKEWQDCTACDAFVQPYRPTT